MKVLFVHLILSITVLWLAITEVAATGAGSWYVGEFAKVRLLSSVEAVGARKKVSMGLQFRLEPGWKIYWRSPGDAGYPPRPVWDKSENLANIQMRWPAPERFSVLGLETLGYENEVIFPLDVLLKHIGQPLGLRASISYLICNEICVPESAMVDIRLPAGQAVMSSFANILAKFDARVPGDGKLAGFSIQRASIKNVSTKTELSIVAIALSSFIAPDLYVEGPDHLIFGAPKVLLNNNGRRAVITVTSDKVEAENFKKPEFIFTLVDGIRSMEQLVSIEFENGYESDTRFPFTQGLEKTNTNSLTWIILLALFGGFILNFMPCVLPVLSFKLMSVIKNGGQLDSTIRLNFLASTAGIISSFMLIAGVLIGLKAGGHAIGWGMQFQQPIFLIGMTFIITLFASNLFGLFEITLPPLFSKIPVGGEISSLSSNFLTGAFATLLATPCSAPFLGTAIGYSLSRGNSEILIVFFSMSIGLAVPYLLVVAFPVLGKLLPRPGPWMIWLRYVLGIALCTTAIWLIFIMKQQIGIQSVLLVSIIMGLIPATFFARRFTSSGFGRHTGKTIIGLAIVALIIPLYGNNFFSGTFKLPIVESHHEEWLSFNREDIDQLVEDGKFVFVDVTASWCATCQLNKKTVIENGDVAVWLSQRDVVKMRADWSEPDGLISQYLASYGRYGIPFNAVYGLKAPWGLVLPELLTKTAVLKAARIAGSDTTRFFQ